MSAREGTAASMDQILAMQRTVTAMIVKCKSTQPGKENCPMIRYCIARMNDRTITGCGIPLWYAGVIRREQVEVEHTVRDGHGATVKGRKSVKRKDGDHHDNSFFV